MDFNLSLSTTQGLLISKIHKSASRPLSRDPLSMPNIFDRFDVLTSTKGFPIKFNTKGEAIKFLGDLGMYIPEDSEEGEIQIDRLH